jgi:hypothetical protein
MSDPKKVDLLVLGDPQSGPPPTDMFYPKRGQLELNTLDPIRFGLAIGLGWAVIFSIMIIVARLRGLAQAFDLFKSLYPGFVPAANWGLLLGFSWSFVYGVVFGLLVGVLYNLLMKYSLSGHESWEMFVER